MKVVFDPPLSETVQYFLKRCRYREILDSKSGRRSWVRPLNRSGHYPRFHCHIVDDTPMRQIVDIHYDVLRPLHRKESSASENFGPVLEQEIERIKNCAHAVHYNPQESPISGSQKIKKKQIPWWKKLFLGG